MKILDFLKEKKLDRKHFIYATGAIALGGFLLAKFPIKFLSKRAENIYSSNRKIQVRENPDSVKRIKA
ncbi:MAG: hypothetical protein ACOYN6_15015 [Ignavibacteria bacterium]|jgi:hypothetical protein